MLDDRWSHGKTWKPNEKINSAYQGNKMHLLHQYDAQTLCWLNKKRTNERDVYKSSFIKCAAKLHLHYIVSCFNVYIDIHESLNKYFAYWSKNIHSFMIMMIHFAQP